jgi:Cu(I)/Ag(I) efflux system membrane fusion protein
MVRKTSVYAAAFLAVFVALVGLLPAGCTEQPQSYRFEAVSDQIGVGKNQRLEVRLLDAKGNPVDPANVNVTLMRLDMGPDGMAAMTAPLQKVTADKPGAIAFEAEITMAGRWALTLEASVAGAPAPVKGEVIFTAAERKSDATPAAPAAGDRRVRYYRNPMGLPDVSPTPKKDSMGMDYIPVYADEASAPKGSFRVSLAKVQRAGVRAEPVMRRSLSARVKGAGTVTVDESRIAVVNAKFDGFVERLNVRTTGAAVAKGTVLLSVWIEGGTNTGQDVDALLRKQADYIAALNRGGPDVATTARNLRNAGMAESVLEEIARTRRAVRTMPIVAPISGTIIEKPALDGMRFSSGETLFKLADLSQVWVIAEIPEQDIGLIRTGQSARLAFVGAPGDDLAGTVDYVYPSIDAMTRSGKVRIALANGNGALKIGQFAQLAIDVPLADAPLLAIPQSAVIDDGERKVALIDRGEGLFAVRNLTLGRRGGDYFEVRDGLKEGERVVVAGTFLMDSESNLQAALQAFTAGESAQ